MVRVVHVLNVFRINSVLQAERFLVSEGYKELVRYDSSLMSLESSQFGEDDEIVGMMVNKIQKDMIWYNAHHQQPSGNSHFFNNNYSIKGLKISIMEKVQTIKVIWNKKEMKNGTTRKVP